MNRTSLFLAAGGLFIVVAAGCQAIAGLESRTTDPQATGCSLPSSGAGRVRLANMANVAGNTDFCIKTSGSSDWGRPVFRDGGNDALCLGTTAQPGGLAYAQSTVPFAVPVGKIDVKAIPAGKTCTNTKGTSEKDGIAVGDNATSPVVTLVRWGGGTSAEGISGLQERGKQPLNSSTYVRIVNALSDGKALTAGISQSAFLPATVDRVVVSTPFAPGSVPVPQGSASELFGVDSNGYMSVIDQPIDIAAALASDTSVPPKAVTVYTTASDVDVATFYVIGDPSDATNGHVVHGLYCQDGLSEAQAAGAAGAADAGVDAGSAAAAAALAHDQTLLQQCTPAALPVLSVDLINAGLYGANAPFELLRGGLMPAAIAARTSDLSCVVEVEEAVNRTAIINAAAGLGSNAPNPIPGAATNPGWYKYYYQASTTSTTPFTNPADNKSLSQNPPCGPSAVSPALVDAMFQCVDSKCSSAASGQDGGTGLLAGTTSCLTGACVSPLGRLYTSPAPSDRTSTDFLNDACLDCAVYYFTSEVPLSEAQTECTTDNRQQPFAFEGATPSLILSHHPLKNMATYVLPATGYRRAVLKAQVVLEDQSVIDFFCAQLSSPLIDSSLPYTGNYGNDGPPPANGWEDEQDLQATEAVAWIQSEVAKDGVPAIIASDLHADVASGGASVDGGLSSLSPEVLSNFNGAFTPAVPQNFTPTCDYCPAPQNPYNAGAEPAELMHAYVVGFPTNATQSETLWGTDNTAVVISQGVPGEVTPPGGTGPLFEFYAHNYTILRP